MLRTIDDIHKYFYSVEGLWEKLTSEESLISFYHIELKDIGLTDDLYIKMNARGRLLSAFENFKAIFQKLINDEKWDVEKEFKNTFASKIDSVWTDLFWSYTPNHRIDDAFLRFISTIAMCRQSIRRTENRLSVISKLQDNYNSIKADLFSKDDFIYLCNSFDKYCEVRLSTINIDIDFPLFQHKPENSIFQGITYDGQSASYTQKVLFYAQTDYLLKASEFNKEYFLDWMRVVRNIVARGDVVKNGNRPAIIRSPQTFDGVIGLIHELSQGCENIYEYLSSATVRSAFAKDQLEEELVKSKLITLNKSNKDSIFKAEDTNLLQGRINFALYCINYNTVSIFDNNALDRVSNILINYFNNDSHISSDLRRALLTVCDDSGKYNYYDYWWSFWNVANANKRCLLDRSLRELEYYIYGNNSENYKVYLKKLILELMTKNMLQVAKDFVPLPDMPNWKIKLIKEKGFLDYDCRSNHIAIPNDESSCYLLKSLRPRDLMGCLHVV